MPNINDYSTTPSTPYREFVDKLQERIAFVNAKNLSDDDRLSLLKGALLSLLEINPDNIVELSIEQDDDPIWDDDDDY